MSQTFVSPAISSSLLKSKWKDQYGSSSFNKKLYGVVPHGIYRGLTLSTSGSNNTVTVTPDATTLDHLAVYETADGFSVTLRDPSNTTYSLALTDASVLSQTVVVAIFVEYKEGQNTTANFVAYTLAEYAALSASLRSELLVLGTVVNPASGNLITSITANRRTVASFNTSLLLWRPLLSNPGFERSPDNHTLVGFEVEGWTSTGNWQTTSTGAASGTRCIQYVSPGATSGQSERCVQTIGTSVTVGQKILVKLSKKVVAAASVGSGKVLVGFTGDDGGSAVEQSTSFTITSTDSSYDVSDYYFIVPSGAITLKYIGFSIDTATYPSSGAKVRIDNVQALLEPMTAADQLAAYDERYRALFASAMILEDFNETTYGELGALLKFSRSTPSSEGEVSLERKDQDYSGGKLPPALALLGRMVGLGSELVGTEANALKPRIEAPTSVASSSDFTCQFESARDGETTGGYTQPVVRIYTSPSGEWVATQNAVWGGTTWTKDVAGQKASRWGLSKAGATLKSRNSDTAWSDSAWDATTSYANPLSDMADARTPRMETTLLGGSVGSTNLQSFDYNLLSSYDFGTEKLRVFASYDTTGFVMSVVMTINASWDGTNWAKDNNSNYATRIYLSDYEGIRYEVVTSLTTWTDVDWYNSNLTSLTNMGGVITAGHLFAGEIDPARTGVISPSGKPYVSVAPRFGKLFSGNERVDTNDLISAGYSTRMRVDSFGLLNPAGPYIFEEFIHSGVPTGWQIVTGAGGSVTFGEGGFSRVRLKDGSGAYLETVQTEVYPPGTTMSIAVKFHNTTGTMMFGLIDGSANIDLGFVQDSAGYGDENIRVVCRTGAGLQVHDTGVTMSGKNLDAFFEMRMACVGNFAGSTSTDCRIMWQIDSLSSDSGIFDPGDVPVNPSTGRKIRFGTLGADITVDRVVIQGASSLFGA